MKQQNNSRLLVLCFSLCIFFNSNCIRYSFSGVTIPENVQTIFIPFFPNQAQTAVPGLPDLINEALIERFVNQSRLQLSDNRDQADAIIEGRIISYKNEAFSISSEEAANLNRVEIGVQASFLIISEDKERWNKRFSGFGEFDPAEDPINGENQAANEAIEQLVENMFNEALGSW